MFKAEWVWRYFSIFIGLFMGSWVYAAVSSLENKAVQFFDLSRKGFRINLIISLLYFIFLSIYYYNTMNSYDDPPWVFLIIILRQLFLAYTYFFVLTYFSKLIATLEIKSEGRFKHYIYLTLYFFFFWWAFGG